MNNTTINFCPECHTKKEFKYIVCNNIDEITNYGNCIECGSIDNGEIVLLPPKENSSLTIETNNDVINVKSIRVNGININIGSIYNLNKNIHEWSAWSLNNKILSNISFSAKKISHLNVDTAHNLITKFHGWFASINGLGLGELGSNTNGDSISNGTIVQEDIGTVLEIETFDSGYISLRFDSIVKWYGDFLTEEDVCNKSKQYLQKPYMFVCPICKTNFKSNEFVNDNEIAFCINCNHEGFIYEFVPYRNSNKCELIIKEFIEKNKHKIPKKMKMGGGDIFLCIIFLYLAWIPYWIAFSLNKTRINAEINKLIKELNEEISKYPLSIQEEYKKIPKYEIIQQIVNSIIPLPILALV